MFNRKPPAPHIPPRIRAYGRARIDIAQRAQTRQDWDKLWKPPSQAFPFEWGQHWRQCIEYKVDDFAAEVGFFIDILGLPVNAFNADYAMFTSPGHDFYFAVVPAAPGAKSTPPDAIRLQFMVDDIFSTTQELERRGIQLEQAAQPLFEGSQQWVAVFHTPHGINMEIWGLAEMVPDEPVHQAPAVSMPAEKLPQSYGSTLELSDLDLESDEEEMLSLAQAFPDLKLDDEASADEVDESEVEEESIYESEDLGAAEEEEPAAQPRTPWKADPAPLNTFQSGQEMLDHLKQKKNQRQFSQTTTGGGAVQTQPPPQPPSVQYRPAPKVNSDKSPGSIWDQVDQGTEYIDVEEPDPDDEYHYKPIPLERKP
jgi:catechol 2,3-dioxygenase-like lactoylglutathione lyase family enzyme